MVFPSTTYMSAHNFGTDYAKAFREDPELLSVLATIAGVFSDRGYPLRSLEQEMRRRLGDPLLIRRAIERDLHEQRNR